MTIEAVLRTKGRRVSTIAPWATVAEAARRLAGPPRIGALVVTRFEHGITGLVTERDLVRALHTYGPRLIDLEVREVMSQPVPTCSPSDSVHQAMDMMTRTKYRHLPVFEDGELVGLVSIGDLVQARLTDLQTETGVLRDLNLAHRFSS